MSDTSLSNKGPFRYLRGVVTLKLDDTKCNKCNKCVEVCPHRVFQREGKELAKIVDHDACMECGACALNCESGAITVDSGVGCAAAIIWGWIRGTEPSCDCSSNSSSCC